MRMTMPGLDPAARAPMGGGAVPLDPRVTHLIEPRAGPPGALEGALLAEQVQVRGPPPQVRRDPPARIRTPAAVRGRDQIEDTPAARLAARIAARQAVIAVIGLGHVGLPLALASAGAGFRTIAFDIDRDRIGTIAAGRSPFVHLPSDEIRSLTRAGRLAATADPAMLAVADAVLICVPTPLAPNGTPDLSHVSAAVAEAVRWTRPGMLLVLESTTWPGTTRQLVAPLMEARGWQIGQDAFLAYSPEREDPGNARFRTAAIPKLVAGADPVSHRLALALYGAMVDRAVPVARMEEAEAAKLVENVFRAVNIALANELKLGLGAIGIDAWKVIEAAATKPFGFMPFWPGPGPGGHCIPVDPVYLSWVVREGGAEMPLLDAAIAGNAAAPVRVAARMEQLLGGLRGRRILLVGLGYKRNIADVRDSPALVLLETLDGCGATVGFHDPLVPVIPPTPEFPGLQGRVGLDWSAAIEGSWDAALIATDHDGVDYAALRHAVPLVVDTRNTYGRRGLPDAGVVMA